MTSMFASGLPSGPVTVPLIEGPPVAAAGLAFACRVVADELGCGAQAGHGTGWLNSGVGHAPPAPGPVVGSVAGAWNDGVAVGLELAMGEGLGFAAVVGPTLGP
jgi:hypothetical protein